MVSEEASQIAVKRREAKSKGEKEKCKHLNAEFQRIARRDKKAFFSDQCKEIEKTTGIPSPPLALFVVMLSKAHLTSHSWVSGSR